MNTIPAVSELTARKFVGEQNYRDGKKYFRSGFLHNLRKQGKMLTGDYSGPDGELAMKITFNERGIASTSCTCGKKSHCKHAAALLVAWQQQPLKFTQVGTVRMMLERLSKDELIALIEQVFLQQPELERLLEAPSITDSMQPTEETWQRRVEDIFRRNGYGRGVKARVAGDLSKIQAIADRLTEQQRYLEAMAIYKEIVLGIMKHYRMFPSHDEDGDLVAVVRECVDALGECLNESAEDIEARQVILQALFAIFRENVEVGDYSFQDATIELLLENTMYQERRTVAGWVRDALTAYDASGQKDYRRKMYTDFLLDLEGETLDEDDYLQACREAGRTVDLVARLLELRRIDEAVKEAEQVSNQDLFKIADIFVEEGYTAKAKRLMQERARRRADDIKVDDILIKIWLNNHS